MSVTNPVYTLYWGVTLNAWIRQSFWGPYGPSFPITCTLALTPSSGSFKLNRRKKNAWCGKPNPTLNQAHVLPLSTSYLLLLVPFSHAQHHTILIDLFRGWPPPSPLLPHCCFCPAPLSPTGSGLHSHFLPIAVPLHVCAGSVSAPLLSLSPMPFTGLCLAPLALALAAFCYTGGSV